MIQLFPFMEYWWAYAGFTVFILILLAIDLGIFQREAHAVSFREALTFSAIWVSISLIFNAALFFFSRWRFPRDPRLMAIPGFDPEQAARTVGLEFLAGYIVEWSLSVDNIFIFVLVFKYFRVPAQYLHRVLFYGIMGALIFRGIFIALGAALLKYHWMLVAFGVFLIITGIRMVFTSEEEEVDPEHNFLVRIVRRMFPVKPRIEGPNFFERIDGKLYATPLLICLVFLEATDIIFAIDSVPAIFALTSEPFIVFTSNVLAILGLRSLFFMLAGAVEKFHLLRYGLAAVLIFVGLKMAWLNDAFGGKFPIKISLAIIGSALALSIILSLVFPPKEKEEPEPPPMS